MDANQNEVYLFAIPGGTLHLSFEGEGVLRIAVTAKSGETAETDRTAETNETVGATLTDNAGTSPERVAVLVEESVVSFASFSMRVIVWKYPLSIQVLTESGEWLLRVESIEIESEIERLRSGPVIRVTAERSAEDEIIVTQAPVGIQGTESTQTGQVVRESQAAKDSQAAKATHAEQGVQGDEAAKANAGRLIHHRRENSQYALLFHGPYVVDVDSRLDAYTIAAEGRELHLCLLHGPALPAADQL